jgi:hypothetical protein
MLKDVLDRRGEREWRVRWMMRRGRRPSPGGRGRVVLPGPLISCCETSDDRASHADSDDIPVLTVASMLGYLIELAFIFYSFSHK